MLFSDALHKPLANRFGHHSLDVLLSAHDAFNFPGSCAEFQVHHAVLCEFLNDVSRGNSDSFKRRKCSLNTVLSEVVPPGDVVTGMRQAGRMSVVRRFFCLFVTFDLLFTILMWLICIMEIYCKTSKRAKKAKQPVKEIFENILRQVHNKVKKKSQWQLISADVFKMMSEQIVHYNIHTSLFDIVMAAAARFVILLLFYALLYMNHWCIIALSTAGTCCFLIAKVFLYNWLTANSPVFQVLLIITSFVISWGEAWFFDFRVIPQELLAQDIVRGRSLVPNERSPLLAPYLQGLSSRHDDNPESVRNFYSPMDSPAGSEDEEQLTHRASKKLLAADIQSHVEHLMQTAPLTLTSNGWRREKETSSGDIVESRPRPQGGKMYRLEGEVSITPQQLLKLLFNELESFPAWNPTLTLARCLQVVDEQTDVSYQIMAEAAGGIVSPRDLVILRHWETQDSKITLASMSITHPAAPATPKPIRADQGPSCFIMEPGSTAGCTHLQWLLDIELHGWIPQTLLDQTFPSAMTQWMTHLRKHTGGLVARPSASGKRSSSSAHKV